jgi:hypothetical protein
MVSTPGSELNPENEPLEEALTPEQLSERADLDARLLAGETLPLETLIAVFSSPVLPEGDLLLRYSQQLLTYALNTRNAEVSLLVTRLMDAHPDIDVVLWERLSDQLQTEPDSVYALIRARMADGMTDGWRERLKAAAMWALQVAITDGDSETAANWLKLVAREPASYELSDIVHHGIMAAADRAHQDGVLGRLLIPLAARRDAEALEAMLADRKLLDAMAESTNLGRVLRDYDGDVLQTLQNLGLETFVIALARAAQAKRKTLFSTAAVEQVWAAANSGQSVNVPGQYTPETIIDRWLQDGAAWLDESALGMILALAARDRRDDVFLKLAHQLAGRESFVRLVATALQRSGRTEPEILALTAQLQTGGDLTAQNLVDVYIRLLTALEWRKTTLPIVHQLVRTLQHQAGVTVSLDVLWQLLERAEELKDESIIRVVVRRFTSDLEGVEDEAVLVERVLRLVTETQWHAPTRQYIVTWWRTTMRATTLARLQRVDKALDGKKPLEELRAIVQTVLSFRRLLGKRNLQQLSTDVATAYAIMQALSDSFDPSSKRPASFDQTTMRAELDSRSSEITPHEQQILANNFKELAQLITGMGENRTKASLMRRGDDVDRLLMAGDQQPQSAVDALKWLAGYLSGGQEKDDVSEE